MKKILRCTFLLIFMITLIPKYAYAYLDPSSTSYVIQAIAGVFIAGGAAIGIYRHKIKLWFKKRMQR